MLHSVVAIILFLIGIGSSSAIRVKLKPLDVEYIAVEYDANGNPVTFDYASLKVSAIAVDARRSLVYTVGRERLSVLRIRRNKTLELVHTETFDGMILSSIQTCKGFVTTTSWDTRTLQSRVFVFRGYNKRTTGNLEMIHSLPADFLSLHHAITRNCRRIIVANNGFQDLNGSMTVITFGGSKFQSPVVKTLLFSEFADQRARLESEAFVFDAVQNIRPSWVCLNKKETKAYVALKQNNGLAVVDFTPGREKVVKIKGLGLKDWSVEGGTQGLDGSRTPREARLRNAPIFSTYDSERISCETIRKQDYIFIASEGEGRNSIPLSQIGGFPGAADPEQFGDLLVNGLSPLTDTNNDSVIDRIVFGGSRSFSVVCGRTLTIAADTGSELELRTMNSVIYNSIPSASQTLLDDFDDNSILRGPEPEAIITKRVCKGRYILMVGSAERPGHLFVYTLDTRNIKAGFVFQDKVDGYSRTDSVFTNGELYDARQISLQDPQGLAILGGRSRDRLMLVSGSRRTSTVELFDIYINCKAKNTKEIPTQAPTMPPDDTTTTVPQDGSE